MINGKKVYVIIGAAGSGKRMAAPLPKQFIKIGNKTILETALDKFYDSKYVDQIILVTAKEYMPLCCRFFSEKKSSNSTITEKVVQGGVERQESIYAGVKTITDGTQGDIVLIHDGVRPYVSTDLINRVIEETCCNQAVIPVIEPKDTIRDQRSGTLERKYLYNVQTPQGFEYTLIASAHKQAEEEGFCGTDDGSLIDHIGEKPYLILGEEGNIKITTREDLKMESKIGSGYDVHKLVEHRKLILGGVEIPFDKGLLGHSDADVLTHAIMDALLGAAGLGDIGIHFPDTDKRYKDISSMALLANIKKLLYERNYAIGNIDATIICQKPKLAEHIPEMKKNISETLEIDLEQINIKATTTEKLGFTGREEGIATEAVCLVKIPY